MVQKHVVQGYENFVKKMQTFQGSDTVYVYFCGSKLPSGQSWCDDCIRAWPTIEAKINALPAEVQFVYVEVGDRPSWKNPDCPFRHHDKARLMVLPTIMKWNTVKILQGEQCENPELVEMLFEDED